MALNSDLFTVVLNRYSTSCTGAEQTQMMEKVLLNDKEIPADSYTVAGNTATTPGSYTLAITAKGNYIGSIEWTYVFLWATFPQLQEALRLIEA